ncbi:subtilisin-like protease pr1a [Diplodia corticola]|uniref:Subtilisin-like protease pr1a n=1 Tax=Diplodia corticola TaxID=236234 RepID=A0A1J9RUH7_9PEZI|nr:subtilisin-like protease pr1a [Diplodia corticola]OJD36235.1 subtilisin-like protease pr1a [Diplodia corticola]
MRFVPLLPLLPLAAAAPLLEPKGTAEVIPGEYIVVMKPEAKETEFSHMLHMFDNDVRHVYSMGSFRGAAGSLDDQLLNAVQNMDSVMYIERNTKVHTAAVTQSNATWGLGRISHRQKGSYNYVYDASAGAGTCSYIIDTGIYTGHPDFEGRASFLADFSGENNTVDGNGHGTHVAGTVGSKTYGVAKKTSLFAVKVLRADGSGDSSGVLKGIEFAAMNATARQKAGQCPKGSVANMSLGGLYNKAQKDAVKAAIKTGLFMSVAAGNDGLPSLFFSPANEASACTVGATDKNDRLASFSNWGALVDILAPGVDIQSTWNDGKTRTISGTSMAAPHIAGLGAYLLGLEQRRAPKALCQRMQDLSTKNKISNNKPQTKNYLAFNGISA